MPHGGPAMIGNGQFIHSANSRRHLANPLQCPREHYVVVELMPVVEPTKNRKAIDLQSRFKFVVEKSEELDAPPGSLGKHQRLSDHRAVAGAPDYGHPLQTVALALALRHSHSKISRFCQQLLDIASYSTSRPTHTLRIISKQLQRSLLLDRPVSRYLSGSLYHESFEQIRIRYSRAPSFRGRLSKVSGDARPLG